MAEIVRRRSWGGGLPLGRHVSISGSRSIHAPSVSIAPSSFQEEQNARHHKQFKLEQALALQLRFSFDVSVSCDGLVSAAPHRPGDDVSRADAALGQAHRHTPDLLNRPADQSVAWRALVFVFGGGDWLARRRTAAIIAKASITRETCRCQPCHERVSL